jgi:hypothetical protein
VPSTRTKSPYLPIAGWLPECTSKSVRTDIIAGIALAGLLVPEGMAYAGIAGVPPQMGLYAALAGMFSMRSWHVPSTRGHPYLLVCGYASRSRGSDCRWGSGTVRSARICCRYCGGAYFSRGRPPETWISFGIHFESRS